MPLIDLLGRRFGRLIVVEQAGRDHRGMRWFCICDCGRLSIDAGQDLRDGTTNSCGCLVTERMVRRNTTHGCRYIPEYRVWKSMKDRCTNPRHPARHNYGGRGIRVHPAWLASFEQFYRDVGPRLTPRHTLDRINNDGNYEPGNVRWATWTEQAHNRRPTPRGTDGRFLCNPRSN